MMFKKSTIVLIAVSVAFWIALLSVVAAIASTGVPYREKNIEITTGSEKIAKQVDNFSTLSVNSCGVVFSDNAKVNICQSDTISSPVIIFPKEVEDFITYSVVNDTLSIDFPAMKPGDVETTVWIKGGSPLTILTPSAPQLVTVSGSLNPFPIVLQNVKTDKIRFTKNGNMTLHNCNIDSLTLTYPPYYNEYNLKVNNSEIGVLKTQFKSKYSTNITVAQDSASTSTIKHIDWDTDNRKYELVINRIPVNELTYKGDAMTLYIKNNATVGKISSK